MEPKTISALTSVLLLSACTMIPTYTRPSPPVPDAWSAPAAADRPAASPPAAETPWDAFFSDPDLRAVVRQALDESRDLRLAALGVEKAAALFRIQRSELAPAVGAQAADSRSRLPRDVSGTGRAETVEQASVQVGFTSWEIDLFGRLRSLKAAALEQYLAADSTRRAVQIAVVGAVSRAYLTLAADHEALSLARSTLESQQASLELIRRSRGLGMASDLDLRRAESQVAGARAAVAAYTGLVAADRNALNLVVGSPVPDHLLPTDLETVTAPTELAPDLPSDVLLGRPDIVAAEHRLRAANAMIGAARAAFFPRISLTAAAGTMSAQLDGLFDAGSGTWTFNPVAVAPIFAGGSLKANLKAVETERAMAVAQYEKAIQTAFAEVGDALAYRRTLGEQRASLEDLVAALEETYRLADARYRGGIDGYLSVLVAQQSLFAAQQELVAVRLAEESNRVGLYTALGGGAPADAGPEGGDGGPRS